MKDKYKPWSLLDLLKAALFSAGIPIAVAIFNKPTSLSKVFNLLWLYTGVLLVIFAAFFARDRWCCSKKDEQIELLERDTTKRPNNRDAGLEEQPNQEIATQASEEYVGKHGMHRLDNKIN